MAARHVLFCLHHICRFKGSSKFGKSPREPFIKGKNATLDHMNLSTLRRPKQAAILCFFIYLIVFLFIKIFIYLLLIFYPIVKNISIQL